MILCRESANKFPRLEEILISLNEFIQMDNQKETAEMYTVFIWGEIDLWAVAFTTVSFYDL